MRILGGLAICLCVVTGILVWNLYNFPGAFRWINDRVPVAVLAGPAPPATVHTRGIVTYADNEYLCLQDASGAFCFRSAGQPKAAAGDKIDVWAGVSRAGQNQPPQISPVRIKKTGHASQPKAIDIAIGDFPSGKDASARVKLTAIVHWAGIENGALRLILAGMPEAGGLLIASPARNVLLQAVVLDPGTVDVASLPDSEVSLTGVIATGSGSAASAGASSDLLLVASGNAMEMVRQAPSEQVLVPSLRALFDAHSLISGGHKIRIRGRVAAYYPERHIVVLASQAGALPVGTVQDLPVRTGDYLEATGFPRSTEYKRRPASIPQISLQHASCRLLTPEEARAADAAEATALEQSKLPILTVIRDIRHLTTEEARKYYPVRIEGVVTFARTEPPYRYFFVQDASAGIFVDSNEMRLDLRVGDRVRVTGITTPGGFAPIVSQPLIEMIGKGPLPKPVIPSMETLSTDGLDSAYVLMEGIVHPVKQTRNGQSYFELFTRLGRVRVAPNFVPDARLEKLVDAHVRARGVLATSFNQQRQLTGVVLFLNSVDDLTVVGRPPGFPFVIPVLPVQAINQYSPRGESSHRIRIRGVVTMVHAANHLYISDTTGGLEVFADASALQPGDLVEAVGYGAPGSYSPVLQDAFVRKVGSAGTLPVPLITVGEALSGAYDNQLVQIEARLVNRTATSSEETLLMRSEDYAFTARMGLGEGVPNLSGIREGSILRLTGICSVQVDPAQIEFNNSRVPQSFRLLFRSPSDVTVIREAPWWNLQRTLVLLAIMTVAVLLALAWVIVLGRRVHSRTAQLRESKHAAEAAREIAERAHRESKALVENSPYGIATLDANGALLEANPAFRKIADIDRNAPVAGILLPDLFRMDHEGKQRFTTALRDGHDFQHMELTCMCREANTVTLRISGLTVPTEDGNARVMEIITEDITSQRQLEQQLLQAQRIEAVGRLAGGIAHDFNNLLMIINSYTSMLVEQFDRYSPEGLKLHAVEEAAQRAASLTHQLLAYSRKQMLEPRVLDIDSHIGNLKDMLRRLIREDVDMRFDLLSQGAHVKVDPIQLEQVLINLAVNARDAMPGGGVLTLRTERSSVLDGGMPPGEYVSISVSDTGIGMDKSTQERIFEPFFTTKELGKGTGLGLSMVYGIIKQSGGFIFVDSSPGVGSTFHLHLPLVEVSSSAQNEDLVELSAPQTMATILVVEDQAEVRNLIAETLKHHGYRTLQAGNGEEGLALAKNNLNTIDMIVSDSIMPKMSGSEFRDKLRTLRPDILVLFMSGYTDHEVGEGFLDDSTQFLQKPFSPRILITKVREMLASRGTAQSLPYQLPLR